MLTRIALLASLLLFASCGRAPRELVLSGPTMGTTYTVKVAGSPQTVDAEAVRRTIDDVLALIDTQMSTYRADSALSRFNATRSTDWVDVPAEVARVIALGQEISRRSDGAFDMTVAPLIRVWGFGPSGEPEQLPTDEQLAAIRREVGYSLLDVREDTPALRKHTPELTIDVNGIAPGYAVDVLAARFAALGLRDFMIDIGGEVLARGRNANGVAWRIAVERPQDTEPTPYKILELHDESVTTSGEYRHYFEREGRRYSHTIDPRTGQPIESHGSVVVVGNSSAAIDAWATAMNVLGPDAGVELADREGLAVMYVLAEGSTLRARTSAAFERNVRSVEGERVTDER